MSSRRPEDAIDVGAPDDVTAVAMEMAVGEGRRRGRKAVRSKHRVEYGNGDDDNDDEFR